MQEIPNDNLSRNEMLNWINDLLKVNLAKIEQLSTGAIYCQILDVLYPGKIPLNKVNWKAKLDYEFVYNFKILQQSFLKLGINKPINIEKLIKSKYQDNFEFITWLKRFYDSNNGGVSKEYNPLSRRNNIEVDLTFLEKPNSKPANVGKDSASKNYNVFPRNSSREIASYRPNSLNKNNSNMSFLSNKENEILEKLKDEKQAHYDVLKAEREFFFGKLRDIDHLLDNLDEKKTVKELTLGIRSIIYMTPEKTVVIEQDGTIKLEENNDNILNIKELCYNNQENCNYDISMQIE